VGDLFFTEGFPQPRGSLGGSRLDSWEKNFGLSPKFSQSAKPEGRCPENCAVTPQSGHGEKSTKAVKVQKGGREEFLTARPEKGDKNLVVSEIIQRVGRGPVRGGITDPMGGLYPPK